MSVIPAAIDGLLQLRYQNGLQGVQVLDGPAAVWPEAEFVAIGLSPEDFTVPASTPMAGLSGESDAPDITCMVRSFSGDMEMKPRRDRVFELFAAIQSYIKANRDLAGPGTSAEIAGYLYAPQVGARGVIADVVFTVRVTKF